MTTQAVRDEWLKKTGPLYPLVVAAKLQTRLLFAPSLVESAEDRERAEPYLPVAGAAFGLLLYLCFRLLFGFGVPAVVVAALLLTASVASTGAWLEVGLGRAIEQGARLWDPTGQPSAGRVALPATISLALLCKFAALSQVPDNGMFAALLVPAIVSRWSVALSLRLWRESSVSREHDAGGWAGFIAVSLPLAIFVLLLGKSPALLSIIFATGFAGVAQLLTRQHSRARDDWASAAGALTEVSALIFFCV